MSKVFMDIAPNVGGYMTSEEAPLPEGRSVRASQ